MRSTVGLATAVLAVVSLAACGAGDGGSSSDDLHVGGMIPMSGPNSASGQPQVDGAKAYFNMVNADGGIDGHKIVFDVADDQLNPSLAPGAMRSLVEDHNALVTGFSCSACTAAIVPYAKAQKLLVVPGSGSTELVEDPSSTVRLAFASYAEESAAVVDYAVKKLGKKRIAVAYTPDAIGKPTLQGVKAQLKELGMKEVAAVEYSPTATSGAAQAAALKASDADFVVVNHVAAIASIIMKANEQIGFKPDYGSTHALSTPSLSDIMGSAIDGRVYFSTMFNNPDAKEAADYKEWVQKVDGSNYKNPDSMNAWVNADAIVAVLRKAVKDAGGKVPTREQVLAAANGLTIDNNYNRNVKWSDDSRTGGTEGRIIVLKGGEFAELESWASLPDVS